MSEDALERFLDELYPYRGESETYRRIPDVGRSADDVLAEVRSFAGREDAMGDEGRVSGSLYCGDHDHYHALSEVFEVFAHANVLQRDMYPSATKFEAEIIAMVGDMLHGPESGSDVCGVVTSGGSESLITALYTYREQAAAERGVTTGRERVWVPPPQVLVQAPQAPQSSTSQSTAAKKRQKTAANFVCKQNDCTCCS